MMPCILSGPRDAGVLARVPRYASLLAMLILFTMLMSPNLLNDTDRAWAACAQVKDGRRLSGIAWADGRDGRAWAPGRSTDAAWAA
eukprot:1161318-Pelagomonas_calceolata.AAC.6